MRSKRSRLDRYISLKLGIARRDVRLIVAQGRISLDGQTAVAINQLVDEFTRVCCDGELLQAHQPVYVMLHKPRGVVSATRDDRHRTVIDLLDRPDRDQLHIVGRLDFNSTGLLLLTNDGRWSRHLADPRQQIAKRYRVNVAAPLTEAMVVGFAEGMAFSYEGITTRPAGLKIIDESTAEVSLIEGRYHQIKRMFGRFDNEVLALHRLAIGDLELDPGLAPGQARELTCAELRRSRVGMADAAGCGSAAVRLGTDDGYAGRAE